MAIRHALFGAGLAILIAGPALAGFDDGVAAYDAGDYAAAREHWIPLAETGDLQAQTALAGLYLSGYGVPQDFRRAADWFLRAAEQGDTIAQLNLGELYERGNGVSRNLPKAWAWYSLAANRGNGWAAERRDAVARVLDGIAPPATSRRADSPN